MRSSGEGANGRWWSGSRSWAPALANLLIGVVAVVPGWCVRWLVVEYPLLRCDSRGCDPDAAEPAPVMAYGAVLGGILVLGLVLMVDVLLPRQEGWRLHRWLGMAVLIPVPFVAGQALGWL